MEKFGLKYLTELVQQHFSEEKGAVDSAVIDRRTATAQMLIDDCNKYFRGQDLFSLDATAPFDEGYMLRIILEKSGAYLLRFDRIKNFRVMFQVPKGYINRTTCFLVDVVDGDQLVEGDVQQRIVKYGQHDYCTNGNLVAGQWCDMRVYRVEQREIALEDWHIALRGFAGKVSGVDWLVPAV